MEPLIEPGPPTTLDLSWDRLHRESLTLAERLRRHGPFHGLVAVTRGGMVPAALIARALDLRLVETVCITSYADRTRGEPRVLKALPGDGTGWLVIDDVADSGATAAIIRSMLPRAIFATVYAKPDGKPHVDHFLIEVPQDCWIVFPWEAPPPGAVADPPS